MTISALIAIRTFLRDGTGLFIQNVLQRRNMQRRFSKRIYCLSLKLFLFLAIKAKVYLIPSKNSV